MNPPSVSIIGSPEWDALSLDEAKAYIRRSLTRYGTDVSLNDEDPWGDGDQSLIAREHSQFYRELFSMGGDMNHLGDLGLRPLSTFACACIGGNMATVRKALKEAAGEIGEGPPREALTQLLERRETSMRLSPLMMVVSMGKNLIFGVGVPELGNLQIKVAKLLLQYGARPDAKEVTGKTVCHYGMGMMATDMTLRICEMCVEAQASHHLYGKLVELHGLQKESLNGTNGWCHGYVADRGRRSVYLVEQKTTVAIKPENPKLARVGTNR